MLIVALLRSLLRQLGGNWLRMNFLLCSLSQDVLELMLTIVFFTAIIDSDAYLVLVLKLTVLNVTSHTLHI